MAEPDIILVNENWRVFGADRGQLFAAMQRLGWKQSASRWFAPKQASADTAFNQLLRAVRPVAGMAPENLQHAMEGQDPELNDVWQEALSLVGPYPVLRAAPELAPGMWLYYPAYRRTAGAMLDEQ